MSPTNQDKNDNLIEIKPLPATLPPPTVWPITLALGTTLMAFGVLTSYIMSLAGLGLFLIGAGGWLGDLRNDQFQ